MGTKLSKKKDEKTSKNEGEETPSTPKITEGIETTENNALEFEETDLGDFEFHTMKDEGDQFMGTLIEDCEESENESFKRFEGIVAKRHSDGKTVILSRHYKILQFINEGHYKGGVCRITMTGKIDIKNGRTLANFKFEQAK